MQTSLSFWIPELHLYTPGYYRYQYVVSRMRHFEEIYPLLNVVETPLRDDTPIGKIRPLRRSTESLVGMRDPNEEKNYRIEETLMLLRRVADECYYEMFDGTIANSKDYQGSLAKIG